ncbi:synaptic vesicular amine transporter-like [Plutella xylostella]|uniref:synaptic vesicular amine transporter-like n=1 Tax=Plutella xylostella TaxID=51655 RepID=UPI002032FD20|nr:synaptic vesicular amine transporter-like [Plutella xylostella]
MHIAGLTSVDAVAFMFIYFTFFLDNVLLTVLVPIVPEVLGVDDLTPPLDASAVLTPANASLTQYEGDGSGAGALAGLALGAKAGAQLLLSAAAGAAVARGGALPVLRAASAGLAGAAVVLSLATHPVLPAGAALAALVLGRALQGAAAAGGGVAGLALVAARAGAGAHRAVAVLLGATALGVLVGYPLGGAAYKLWSRSAPFQLISAAAAVNCLLQCLLLNKADFDHAARAGAGAVFLATAVVAALEPALPPWLIHKFHPQRWARGAVFVPDSVGYLVATAVGARLAGGGGPGGGGAGGGAAAAAVAGQLAVGAAALAAPCVTDVWWLALPQFTLGAGLGAADAALVPALLARRPAAAPRAAALLQAAAAAAYTQGPILGGLVSYLLSFETLLRAMGVANLLYAVFLYRALKKDPLTQCSDDDEEDGEDLQLSTVAVGDYDTLR